MQILPLQDRVLVKRLEEENKTAGGIIIPDNHAERPAQGEVMAVGPGKTSKDGTVLPLTLKKGDKVLFGKYSGNEVKLDGVEYLIMKEDDVLGIVK